ncbi:MAG: polysaccharide lyase 6 family protein [Fuerstiella sp.]
MILHWTASNFSWVCHRITNCAVVNNLPAAQKQGSTRFLSVYGARHRIDHCYLAGKTTEGATMVVWLAAGREAAHRIDHNHFGPRQRLGKNGGETIRVGDSKTSMLTAACVLEHNLFEKCDGEVECISNKSCGNLYRHNRFIGVSGTLTLRHGNGCRVENNVFLGDGARGAGGVRVIGEDHVITGNYFEDLTGDDERSGMCFMLGVPNSPANLYFQVKRATVSGNTFLNCKHNILIGMTGDEKAILPPVDTKIVGNFIQTNRGKAFEVHCDVSGVRMQNNQTETIRPEAIKRSAVPEPAGPTWRD